jgi:hypothetical protein
MESHDSDTDSTTSSELTAESSALQVGSRSLYSGQELTVGNHTDEGKSKATNSRVVVPKNLDHDFSGQQWAPVTVHDRAASAGTLSLPSILSPQQSRSKSLHSHSKSSSLRFPLSSTRAENVLERYSYGPDSLRAKSMRGRVGRALFQDDQELVGYEEPDDATVLSFDPGPEGQALLDAYSVRGGRESPPKTMEEQIAEALEQTARRSKEEQEASMAKIRSRRVGIRKIQGITYLRQRDRRPRAHQELYEERKRRERQEKGYQRPSTPELLKMVQGTPDEVWRSDDIAKRTDFATKAVKLKESMRARAAKEGLIEDKSKSFFQEHLLPMIADNYDEKVDPNYD